MVDAGIVRARRALELGRLRSGLIGAALVTSCLALLAIAMPRSIDPRWLALPFAIWVFVSWRGGALARGGLLGLVAGAAGWFVPMSVLRPCCAAMADRAMTGDCCTRPECCLEAGVVLGIVVAMFGSVSAPRDRHGSALHVAGMLAMAGAALGVRCTGLFLGEAMGLLGGLAAGTLGIALARVALQRPIAAH